MFFQTSLEELSSDRRDLIGNLRQRVLEQLPPKYDWHFNFLRWLIAAEKQCIGPAVNLAAPLSDPSKKEAILKHAEQALRHHLRYRKAMKLDETVPPSWDENPMFKMRLIPRGYIKNVDKRNRLMWWIDYKSMDLKGVLYSIRSSDMVRYHFQQYEEMLRQVLEREKSTGKMSAIHHVGNLDGYGTNPFTMLFASNGQLAYYLTLFHYEHYPELVNPLSFVNTPRWLYYVSRIVKSMSPVDIFDRLRLYDTSSYRNALMSEVDEEQVPSFHGGSCPNSEQLVSIPAKVIPEVDYYKHDPENDPSTDDLLHVRVNARRRKFLPLSVQEPGGKLCWYFKTDGEVFFGVFRVAEVLAKPEKLVSDTAKIDIDHMEMVVPWFRCSAKLVPEWGTVTCDQPGTYFVVFCNRGSWLTRRNLHVKIDIDSSCKKRTRAERTFSF